MLQAPVLGFRRGRGVLDSRDPLSVTQPLGHELWAEADVVLAVGTRLFFQYTGWRQTGWGVDAGLAIIRVDIEPRGDRTRSGPQPSASSATSEPKSWARLTEEHARPAAGPRIPRG